MNTIVIQNCKNFINKILSFMSETHTNKLEESKTVLDKYHLNKEILEATAGQEQYRKAVYSSIYEGDLPRFSKLVNELKQTAQS
ncbi:MAG: hypothetical protein WAO46_00085, partial [Tepidanaerobacteraceae bacterium]